MTPEERFWAKVNKTATCWLWTGASHPDGYGRVRIAGRMTQAHRHAYELLVGSIPDGYVLDHYVCDTPACVNPAHLRPVTQRENILRGTGVAAACAAKTHCPQGHPLSGPNLVVTSTTGHRRCRACQAAQRRKYRARKAAATTNQKAGQP